MKRLRYQNRDGAQTPLVNCVLRCSGSIISVLKNLGQQKPLVRRGTAKASHCRLYGQDIILPNWETEIPSTIAAAILHRELNVVRLFCGVAGKKFLHPSRSRPLQSGLSKELAGKMHS